MMLKPDDYRDIRKNKMANALRCFWFYFLNNVLNLSYLHIKKTVNENQ